MIYSLHDELFDEKSTEEILDFIKNGTDTRLYAIAALLRRGVPADKITLDPGLGFGKDTEHNLLLMRNMEQLAGLGYPVLIGCSRKRFIGAVTGSDVDGRLAGTLAVNAFAASHGAAVLRVHDVRETSDMVKMLFALGDIEVRR